MGCKALERKELPSALVDFVCVNVRAGKPCENRDVARSSTRFQNVHARAKRSGFYHDEGLRRWRAELLEVNLVLVSPCLKRQASLFSQELIERGRRVGKVQPDAVQVDVEPGLGRIVGVAGVSG